MDIVCVSTLVRFQPASFVFFWINADMMQIYYKSATQLYHTHTHKTINNFSIKNHSKVKSKNGQGDVTIKIYTKRLFFLEKT